MSIKTKTLLSLLREVNESTEIGGKEFESRFELQPYSSSNLVGVGQEETKPALRERDRHLLYARAQNLLRFDVSKYGAREDFFGGIVTITPEGVSYLETKSRTWWSRQIEALASNVLTVVVAVIIALLSAWLLKLTGLEQ